MHEKICLLILESSDAISRVRTHVAILHVAGGENNLGNAWSLRAVGESPAYTRRALI